MSSVLITGSSGFLGKHIVKEMNRLQYSIETIGRTNSTISCDISKEINTISKHYDVVIHVAGKAHMVPKTEKEEKEFYDVNFTGTKNLINALDKVPTYFVFISTVSVYGLDYGNNITENAALNAVEPYGRSKVLAERLIRDWGRETKITTTILRLPLLFGKNPPGNLKSMINAIHKRYYFNIGKGDVRKSMVLVDDVSSFIPNIMKIGGVYNLTDGFHPSFKELSDRIALFYKLKTPVSVPPFIILFIAYICEFIERIIRKKMPINKRQFTKITKPLTFSDKKARNFGWKPNSIIDNTEHWLN